MKEIIKKFKQEFLSFFVPIGIIALISFGDGKVKDFGWMLMFFFIGVGMSSFLNKP